MSNTNAKNDGTILVEFFPVEGIQQVALSPTDIAKRSGEALDSVMNTIREVGAKITETTKKLAAAPDEIEIGFGIKLTFEGSAIITKASAESSFTVKMTFKKDLKKST